MASTIIPTILLGNNGDQIPFIVGNATSIAKYAVCELTSPMTVINQTNADTPVVGIASAEKVASDGQTQISVITNCVAKAKVKTDVTVGLMVSMDADDGTIDDATATDIENGINIGWALETATAGEYAMIRIMK